MYCFTLCWSCWSMRHGVVLKKQFEPLHDIEGMERCFHLVVEWFKYIHPLSLISQVPQQKHKEKEIFWSCLHCEIRTLVCVPMLALVLASLLKTRLYFSTLNNIALKFLVVCAFRLERSKSSYFDSRCPESLLWKWLKILIFNGHPCKRNMVYVSSTYRFCMDAKWD